MERHRLMDKEAIRRIDHSAECFFTGALTAHAIEATDEQALDAICHTGMGGTRSACANQSAGYESHASQFSCALVPSACTDR